LISNIDPTLLPIGDGSRVIDIGSGEGSTTVELARLGHRVAGIEINETLVRRMRETLPLRSIPICVADARAMPFADASFDAALLIEVVEHIHDTPRLMGEVQRVLRPGGRVCIGLPTSYTEKIYWRLHSGYARNAGHVRIIELAGLLSLLRSSGFRVLDVQTKNFTPALSWVLHSLLLSSSDDTGRILNDTWVDTVLNALVGGWRRTPGLNRGLDWLSARFGKSWYVYCEKPT
jgi:SAM-dependent methyltransferase